jgi:hypothetical protein
MRERAPSPMPPPNRPWFWSPRLSKRRASIRPALAFDARSVGGRPARTTDDVVVAAMNGTHSIREEYTLCNNMVECQFREESGATCSGNQCIDLGPALADNGQN